MNELFINFFGDIGGVFSGIRPWIVANLPMLKLFSAVLSLLLLYGIVYSIIRSNYFDVQVDRLRDIFNIKNLTQRRAIRGWRRILKYLHKQDPDYWKLAITSADKILMEITRAAGFRSLEEVKLANIEEIKSAHQMALEISQNSDFEITHEAAERAVRIYAQAFRELELID